MSTVKHSPLSQFVKKLLPYRLWVQVGFLLVWLDPLALRMHTLCGPVFHCYACPLATFACPIGVIAQFGALHLFPYFAVGLLITVGIFIGAIVCGWLCPFGLLHVLAAKAPTPRVKIPRWMGAFSVCRANQAVIAVPYFSGGASAVLSAGSARRGAGKGTAGCCRRRLRGRRFRGERHQDFHHVVLLSPSFFRSGRGAGCCSAGGDLRIFQPVFAVSAGDEGASCTQCGRSGRCAATGDAGQVAERG